MKGRTRPTWVLLLLLLLPVLCRGEPNPEPAPDADPAPGPGPDPAPDAEALAEADPQYGYGVGRGMGGYGPPPYMGGLGPVRGPVGGPIGGPVGAGGASPQSACELTNQCCGLANRQCCLGGRNCYTVWERKCDMEDNPECRVRIDQKCYGAKVKDCRIVGDVQYKTFQAKVCSPKPMTRCFTYNKKVCMPATEPQYREVVWENDRLERIGQEMKYHCADVKTYNCTTRMEERIVPHRVPKPVIRKKLQKRCRMVQDVGPASQVEVPVVRIVYRNVCYNMNVPQCSASPCGAQGFCGPAQSVCYQNQFNTNTVCPIAAAAAAGRGGGGPVGPGVVPIGPGPIVGQNCQQVREPVCNPLGGGPCNPGNQQCCSMNTQRVCRQVPQRIVERVKQRVPGAIKWREECKDFFYNITEYIYEHSNRTEQVPKRDCKPVVKRECHNVTVPQFKVVREPKRDRVTVMLPACRPRIVKDRFCHTFPAGDVQCQDQMVRRGFRINRIVCDQDRERPFCFKFPIADCRLGSNTNCRMVPRQVCTNTCSNDPQCSRCNNFVQSGPGFGSCPTSTCGNFYPSVGDADAFNATFGGDFSAGVAALPGGGYAGGFYHQPPPPGPLPGPGGQGYYPGQGVGVGGQGYYGGGQGGFVPVGQQAGGGYYGNPVYPGPTGVVGAEGDVVEAGGPMPDGGYPDYPGAMVAYYDAGGDGAAPAAAQQQSRLAAEAPVAAEGGGVANGNAGLAEEGADAADAADQVDN